jgi:Mrp family chromosome partitioning ATPase
MTSMRFPVRSEREVPMGKPAPTVVVASEDPGLLDEVVRHLDELPAWRLAGWAARAEDLPGLVAAHRPDAVLASAGIARGLDGGPSLPARIVVVATEQDAATLRCTLRLGAGFVLWPQERDALRGAVESGLPDTAAHRARLVAVWGPKGGSGASVLAAHLAAAVAAGGRSRCLLVDLDLCNGDQRCLLGVAGHERSLLDLLAAGDDLTPASLAGVTWAHPAGFVAVLAPPPGGDPLPPGAADPGVVHAALETVREGGGLVVADLPSGLGPFAAGVAGRADAVALVVTPDLLCLRRARDAARGLGTHPGGPDAGIVLNRWSRAGGLAPGDVEAVLGPPVWGRVAVQDGLLRAPDLGRLSPAGIRALAPLAARVTGAPGAAPLAALSAGGRS